MKTTLCMGIFNSEKWLPEVLTAAKGQAFDDFLVFDNDSTDKGLALVTAAFPDARVISFAHVDRRADNVLQLHREMNKAVDGDHMFCLDSDVVLPKDAIAACVEYLKDDVAGVGIPYMEENHVTLGATMFRVDLVKLLPMISRPTCSCIVMTDELKAAGYRVIMHPTLKAKHLKVTVPVVMNQRVASTFELVGGKVKTRYMRTEVIEEFIDEKALWKEILETQKNLAALWTKWNRTQKTKAEQ